MDRAPIVTCPIMVVGVVMLCGPTEYPKKRPPLHACPRLGKLIVSADVAFGSKADIAARPHNVRFTPKSGHSGGCWIYCASEGAQGASLWSFPVDSFYIWQQE